MNAAVKIRNLRKRYGDTVAVDDVSFEVQAGEIVGLLGPNGAGKTTILECAEGLRHPDEGEVEILGHDARTLRKTLRDAMGVQLQLSSLPPSMTPKDAIRIFAAWHRHAPRVDLLERFSLTGSADTPYGDLSVGQQRRLNLALAIAHRPRVLFLDEPTAGLDVGSRADLHEMIRELRREGVAILLATHDMAEAELLADRAVVLLRGRVLAIDTPRALTSAGPALTRISISSTSPAISVTLADDLPDVASAHEEEGYVVFLSKDPGATVSALVERIRAAGDTLEDLRVERPTLEERFLQLTGATP